MFVNILICYNGADENRQTVLNGYAIFVIGKSYGIHTTTCTYSAMYNDWQFHKTKMFRKTDYFSFQISIMYTASEHELFLSVSTCIII